LSTEGAKEVVAPAVLSTMALALVLANDREADPEAIPFDPEILPTVTPLRAWLAVHVFAVVRLTVVVHEGAAPEPPEVSTCPVVPVVLLAPIPSCPNRP
jgi:hypothetical protein